MQCKKCGREVTSIQNFCESCGFKIESETIINPFSSSLEKSKNNCTIYGTHTKAKKLDFVTEILKYSKKIPKIDPTLETDNKITKFSQNKDMKQDEKSETLDLKEKKSIELPTLLNLNEQPTLENRELKLESFSNQDVKVPLLNDSLIEKEESTSITNIKKHPFDNDRKEKFFSKVGETTESDSKNILFMRIIIFLCVLVLLLMIFLYFVSLFRKRDDTSYIGIWKCNNLSEITLHSDGKFIWEYENNHVNYINEGEFIATNVENQNKMEKFYEFTMNVQKQKTEGVSETQNNTKIFGVNLKVKEESEILTLIDQDTYAMYTCQKN